jgi:two-component system, cell cycle sensor histidine kinase and response regulator CckA
MTPGIVPDELCGLLDSASDPIVLADEAGRIAFVNARAEQLFGYALPELVGRPGDVLIPEWDRVEHGDRPAPGTNGQRVLPINEGFTPSGRRKDGTEFPIRVSRSPVGDGERFVIVIVTDISSRPGGGGPVRAGHDPVWEELEHAAVPAVLVDAENRFVRVSAAFARTFGYSPAELLGLTPGALTHPADRPILGTRPAADSRAGASPPTELRYLHRDGHTLWGLWTVSPVRAAGARAPLYLGQFRDVTARKAAEDAARNSGARFQALFAAGTAGMVEAAPDGRILLANDAFCRMTGFSLAELIERTVGDLLFPDDRPRALSQFGEVAAGRVSAYEADRRYRRKDGSALWARVGARVREGAGKPAGVSAVVIDRTDRKELEDRAQRARRAEEVALRAGSLAHDFNNLMAIISGCAELLAAQLPPTGPSRDLSEEMTAACRRAMGLTAQLLALGRQAPAAPRVLDLNTVVAQAVKLLHRLLGPGIAVVTDLTAEPGLLTADPVQVEHLVLNLAINAKDAMPRGGALSIETRALHVREGNGRVYPGLPAGEYVQLAVSDTGTGMTAEVKARAFELFFTTKEVGKGTGLGLTAVHKTVTEQGGRVDVSSEPDVGTIFEILLPVAAPVLSDAGPGHPVPHGTETVLMAESDGAARRLARLALSSHGYEVLDAPSVADALQLAREWAGPIDLVIASAGGCELADRLGERLGDRHPHIKVLAPGAPKAFAPLALVHAVRAALDGPS